MVTGYRDAEQKDGRLQRLFTVESQDEDDQGRTVDRETVRFELHGGELSEADVRASLEDRKQRMLSRRRNRESISWDDPVDST